MNIHSDYISRINKAFDYIERNLSSPMTLDDIASAGNFSKYHFARIFRSMVGETPFQFITRLRIEKAAGMILAEPDEPLSEIAYRCGFSDLSVFSRNFKSYFGCTATEYADSNREKSNLSQTLRNRSQMNRPSAEYICSEYLSQYRNMNMDTIRKIEIKEIPELTVAYIRNLGPYDGNKENYEMLRNKLFAWAGARGLIGGPDFTYIILYHDNPQSALSDNLRMSLCIGVPRDTPVEGEIGKMTIDSAKYAVFDCLLSPEDFAPAWNYIYGVWLPKSGYRPDDKPYFERYPEEPKGGKFRVEFCLPIVPVQ